MFRSRTLFIVGAGGSSEAGLPIGRQLAEDISTRLNITFSGGFEMDGPGDYSIYSALKREAGQDVNDYLEACWTIRDGIILANSIDDFIDGYRDDPKIQLCGKLGIVESILDAEWHSELFSTQTGACKMAALTSLKLRTATLFASGVFFIAASM